MSTQFLFTKNVERTNSNTFFLPLGMIEFDAIAATRGGMQDSMSSRRLLSELLLQLTEQKQLQARDAQLLRLKLASVQALSKRPRSLKRQSENKNDNHSSGASLISHVNNRNVALLHKLRPLLTLCNIC